MQNSVERVIYDDRSIIYSKILYLYFATEALIGTSHLTTSQLISTSKKRDFENHVPKQCWPLLLHIPWPTSITVTVI